MDELRKSRGSSLGEVATGKGHASSFGTSSAIPVSSPVRIRSSNASPVGSPRASRFRDTIGSPSEEEADYCSQTTVGMAESFKKLIDPRLSEKIEAKAEQGDFDGVIAKAIKALVSGLEVRMEPALNQMIKMPWGSWESVEDQSDYVNQISTYIHQSVPLYNDWITNPAHFRFFCNSFSLSFIPLLVQQIYKCRRISEVGAQQLTLDFTAIKGLLLEIPNMGSATNKEGLDKYMAEQQNNAADQQQHLKRFTRHITKEMGKADKLLKVLLAPQNVLVDTYKSIIGADGSEADFQKVMDLKGIARAEQRTLMEPLSQQLKEQQQQQAHAGGTAAPSTPTPTAPSESLQRFKKMFNDVQMPKFSMASIARDVLNKERDKQGE